MDAPPSRYRVVERGGRLEVIDTYLGSAPQTAAELLPGFASDDAVEADGPAWQEQAIPDAPAAIPPPLRPRAAEALIAGPPELVRNVAATMCNDERDADGRLILTTARWFDRKGPRRIALDIGGERKLGTMVMVLLGLTVAAIVAAVIFGWVGIILLGVAAAQLRQVKTVATPWLDRLGVTPS